MKMSNKYYPIICEPRLKLQIRNWSPINKIISIDKNNFYIYAIRCKSTIYIGSGTTPLRQRNHLWKLRKDKHPNSKMQNYFNKYKEKSFWFSIISIIPNDLKQYRLLIENSYIKHFNTYKTKLGFNLLEFATKGKFGKLTPKETKIKQSRSYRKSNETLKIIDKNGKEYLIDNINGFAKEHNINYTALWMVINGWIKTCYGFRLSSTSLDYRIVNLINPKGETVKDTCANILKNNPELTQPGLSFLCTGRFNYYKGWCRPDKIVTSAKNLSKPIELKSPDNRIIKESSISSFARKHDLHRRSIKQLLKGEIVQTKGWTLSN